MTDETSSQKQDNDILCFPKVILLQQEHEFNNSECSTQSADDANEHFQKQPKRQLSQFSGSSNSSTKRHARKKVSRHVSERSGRSGSGSVFGKPTLRRQSSLGIHHIDSFKSLELESKEAIKIKKKGVPWWTSRRLCLAIVCFFGFFCLYAQRVDLSIAIVCMITDEQYTGNMSLYDNGSHFSNNSVSLETSSSWTSGKDNITRVAKQMHCPSSTAGRIIEGEFHWNKQLQGLILGAFFWGYTALQLPGGWLAERYGPRIIISIGMILVTTLTLLTPLCARVSPYLLVVCRVLMGVGEATMYPGAQVLWAKWSPPEERSRLVGFSFGGTQLGNALVFPIASFLCAYGFGGGWPSVFYVIGLISCIWCVVWIVCVRDSPEEVTNISDIEKKYIIQSVGHNAEKDSSDRNSPKPWKAIITSRAVWAILIGNACGNYGAYMLLTQMPSYMKEVLKFDIQSNGVYSMIPYLIFWLFIILAGIFADFFIAREILSIGATRKLCCSIGMFVPAFFLVILGYMDCYRQTEAVVLLTLSMAFCGFQFSSVFINHGDIAPRYAGTIFGITNTGASIPGIIAPYVVGALTPNKSQEEWQKTFYIAAAVYCVGAIVYILLGEGEIQSWADTSHQNNSDKCQQQCSEKGLQHSSNKDLQQTLPTNLSHIMEENNASEFNYKF